MQEALSINRLLIRCVLREQTPSKLPALASKGYESRRQDSGRLSTVVPWTVDRGGTSPKESRLDIA